MHKNVHTMYDLMYIISQVKLSDFGMARILDEQTGIYNLSNLQSRIPIAWYETCMTITHSHIIMVYMIHTQSHTPNKL